MRHETDYAFIPIDGRAVLPASPAPALSTAIAAATDPIPTPTNPIPTPTNPIPTPTDPIPTPTNPIPTPKYPIPTPKYPIPIPVYPIPTPKYPIPTPKNPIPTPVNPIPPPTNPAPTQPVSPPPGAPGNPASVTPKQVGVADVAINGPQARSTGLSGAGIKIGIISNTFNALGGAASDIAKGLLPASGVTVLKDGPAGEDDEGRAMAQLVHATAPSAQLYFYTGIDSEADMAAGVTALKNAGCQIIVDDIGYADEPMFQNAGKLDSAITAAVGAGVDYFAAAGNNNNAAYQAAVATEAVNIPGLGPQQAQVFEGGATTQTVYVVGGTQTYLTVDWDSPFNFAAANAVAAVALSNGNVVAVSAQNGSTPSSTLVFPLLGSDAEYQIAILYNPSVATPGRFKYVLQGDGGFLLTPGGETTGSIYGHAMLPGVNAVGAIYVGDTPSQGGTPVPEYFSSTGGSQFLFTPDGTRLQIPQIASAPDFLAPDGAQTSTLDPFFGTSAAAPVAAATAALMLQARPSLSTGDVTTLLADSALPTGSPVNSAGAGLIQADLATRFAATGIIAGSPQAVIRGTEAACTIQGGGGAHWLLAGSGDAVIQSEGVDSVLAAAGAATVDLYGAQAAVYGGAGPLWVRAMNGNDTIVGGSGAVTVSGGAGGGVIYGGTASGNQLVGGQQTSIVLSQAAGDFVAGGGDGALLYASARGNDTLVGGAGTEILVGPTVPGGAANVFIAGEGSPLIAPEAGAAVVAFGAGDTTVLLGTQPALLTVTAGQAGPLQAIYNFDASHDLLQLAGFGGAIASAQQAVANQYDTGGNAWLKLPDGTVFVFVGLDHLAAGSVVFG